MTTFLLIRHATNPTVGHTLAGRAAGVVLDAAGRAQAAALVPRLAALPVAAVCSSPLERARETAAPLAAAHGLEVALAKELLEVEPGEWTGRSFDSLTASEAPGWREWNTFRSGTRPPGGEHLLEVQVRVVRLVERLCAEHGDTAVIAVVSHADVIRTAIGHFIGLPIDLQHRLDVAPASVSVLRVERWGAKLLRLNDTGPLDPAALA